MAKYQNTQEIPKYPRNTKYPTNTKTFKKCQNTQEIPKHSRNAKIPKINRGIPKYSRNAKTRKLWICKQNTQEMLIDEDKFDKMDDFGWLGPDLRLLCLLFIDQAVFVLAVIVFVTDNCKFVKDTCLWLWNTGGLFIFSSSSGVKMWKVVLDL